MSLETLTLFICFTGEENIGKKREMRQAGGEVGQNVRRSGTEGTVLALNTASQCRDRGYKATAVQTGPDRAVSVHLLSR